MAVAWAWAGRADRAADQHLETSYPVDQTDRCCSLSEACGAIGQAGEALTMFEAAVGTARLLADHKARSVRLRRLETIAATLGESQKCRELFDEAAAAIELIPDLDTRCGALGDLARALLRTGVDQPPHDWTRQLLAQAMTGRWHTPVSLLAEIALPELQRACDQVFEGLS